MKAGASEPEAGGDAAPVSVAGLVLRFAVAGLVAAVLVGILIGVASREVAERQAIAEARNATAVAATGIIEPAVVDALLVGDPAAIEQVDRVVRRSVLRNSLIRVKIWAADGTILYSDDSRLIGERFELPDEELEVLANGGVTAEVSDLSRPDNKFERGGRLLEIYLPIVTPSGRPLLFEAYFRYSGVISSGASLWRQFAPISIAGLLALELVQIPVVWRLARRLRRNQFQRERLLRHAIDASDAERHRIASDLHDGVVQDLSGVSLSLAAATRRPRDAALDAVLLEQSADQIRASVKSLRTLLVDILPPNLQEAGLVPAIGDLLASLEASGISSELSVDLSSADLHPRYAQLLYRGAQEALRNVAGHANASRVVVSGGRARTSVVLRVEDNGNGFDTGQLARRGDDGHVGLRALAGIFADAGGALRVRSAPASGTLVEMEVPQRDQSRRR